MFYRAPVTPQAQHLSSCIGRSSDFVQTAGTPSHPDDGQERYTSCLLGAVAILCQPNNGLTASGNVADLHCVPFLALAPQTVAA